LDEKTTLMELRHLLTVTIPAGKGQGHPNAVARMLNEREKLPPEAGSGGQMIVARGDKIMASVTMAEAQAKLPDLKSAGMR
jgi:hypothetical protein